VKSGYGSMKKEPWQQNRRKKRPKRELSLGIVTKRTDTVPVPVPVD
jgi:hypothetical protein